MRVRFTTESRFVKPDRQNLLYLNMVPIRLDLDNCLNIIDKDVEIEPRVNEWDQRRRLLNESSVGIQNYVTEDCNVSPYRIGKIYSVVKESNEDRIGKFPDSVYVSPAHVYVHLDAEKVGYFNRIARVKPDYHGELLRIGRRMLDKLKSPF